MDKALMHREITRLIAEAPNIAPEAPPHKGPLTYGPPAPFDARKAQRWEVECTGLIESLAASNTRIFVELSAKYLAIQARPRASRASFIREAAELLQTADELLNSPLNQLPGRPMRGTPALAGAKLDELEVPKNVTLLWLIKHVPIHLWGAAAALLFASFVFGIKAADVGFVRDVLGLQRAESPAKVTPSSLTVKP